MEAKLRDTERHLVSLGHRASVVEVLSKKYSVTSYTVESWINKVRRRWAKQAEEEEKALGVPLREGRRTHLRFMLLEIHAKASARTEVVRDKNGNVVIENGRPVVRPNPNLQASLQVMRQLRALDALDAPRVQHVHHSGSVETTVDHRVRSADEDAYFLRHGRYPSAADQTTH